ncbi:MAG: hypothetical protein IKP37_07880 [Paludibacteraceae bacterium]|nr:hypothetical protein [Paludibacteraceae bacterium]
MYKIFWTPATDPSKPATIIIDGQLAEYTGKEEQNLAMVKFGEVRQWPCEKAISEQKGDGRKFSKDLFIAVKPEGIAIRSTFSANDSGRPHPYMYYTDSTDLAEAVDDLKSYAAQTQHKFNTEELETAALEIAIYRQPERDKERERLTSLGGGWEKLWYHVRRH